LVVAVAVGFLFKFFGFFKKKFFWVENFETVGNNDECRESIKIKKIKINHKNKSPFVFPVNSKLKI
jgi:hypothetical protein